MGEGYSYHVYPTTSDNTVVVATGGQSVAPRATGGTLLGPVAPLAPGAELAPLAPLAPGAAMVVGPPLAPTLPYPAAYNPTVGRRIVPPSQAAAALAGGGNGTSAAVALGEPLHQPLIQVKVRVVEIDRSKSLQVSSVLDYIRGDTGATLIMGNNINMNMRNLTASTRFPTTSNLIDIIPGGKSISALTGTGALINLTTGNLNYIARLLENEFHSDIITAPEVVTLNGQNVEFIAGQKVPFALGQNVIQGNNNNIQQFFYKQVGAYISVTPQIVNWKAGYASGGGRAAIIESDVVTWHGVLLTFEQNRPLILPAKDDALDAYMAAFDNWESDIQTKARKNRLAEKKNAGEITTDKEAEDFLATPFDKLREADQDALRKVLLPQEPPVPADVKEKILAALNLSRTRGVDELFASSIPNMVKPSVSCPKPCGPGCDWRPEDCTIDLNVIVRLSTTGDSIPIGVSPAGNAPVQVTVPIEDNVRGIADIVQVKSGHGVVMGGLIGEQEVKDVDKVPVLGDIPGVGFLFRSTNTTRHKTEVVVFIEAKVLDPNPEATHGQSSEDFMLSQPFLSHAFLDNPLEFAMHRAGFGTYLPPHSPEEKIFWERLGRKCRNIATTLDDMFE
jgi:hypothetical protein